MFVSNAKSQTQRKGIILLVVLAMLTLLTMLGVTFVLYSDAAESTAAINMASERNGATVSSIDISPSELMMYAFGQLIYDVEDPTPGDPVAGGSSGLRGHGLARDMYGYYYTLNPSSFKPEPPSMRDGSGNIVTLTDTWGNDRPFRGTGRLQYPITNPETGGPANDRDYINYTIFSKTAGGVSTPALIRDPERYQPRATLTTPANQYFGGANPPYTIADLNHIALAKLDDNGRVSEPSFFRREVFGSSNDPNVPPLGNYNGTNWDFTGLSNWSSPDGKYRMIRPRKAEHKFFPDPSDGWGDVRNLPWGDRNDSVWIDLGVEPKTAPNGKKYKPLFAFLCIDLDGRVNLNAHGNIHGRDSSGNWNFLTSRHASGQGWGAWEVSAQRALSNDPSVANDASSPNWRNIFGASNKPGRFGYFDTNTNNFVPKGYFDIPNGNGPHTYAPVNFNASSEPPGSGGLLDQPLMMPGAAANVLFSPFANGKTSFFGMGSAAERSLNGSAADPQRIHGALFHPYRSVLDTTSGNEKYNHRFADKEMGLYMARQLRDPSKYLQSELVQLGIFSSSPFTSITGGTRDRRYDRVTTLSWDYDKPGVMPYFNNSGGSEALVMNPVTSMSPLPVYPNSATTPNYPNIPLTLGTKSDFDSIGRGNSEISLTKRLNLNRGLQNYPTIPASGTYNATDLTYQKADSERKQFAKDIFVHLIKATGAADPNDLTLAGIFGPGSTDQRYLASRWLAQLAVNIVDNLDVDDVMTPFVWNGNDPSNILFGHELSKVVINEVYAQVENEPSELATGVTTSPTKFNVKVYAELLNPLPTDANQDHRAILQRGNQVVHKLELFRSSIFDRNDINATDLANFIKTNGIIGNLASTDDSLADPFASTNWAGDLALNPSGAFSQTQGTGNNSGFLMVGPLPDNDNGASGITNSRWTTNDRVDTAHADLKFSIRKVGSNIDNENAIQSLTNLDRKQCPVLVLRRLANPGLPLDTNIANPSYNPYITIDLMDITKDMLAANDARKKIQDPTDTFNNKDNSTDFKPIEQRTAFGRQQPYRYIPKDFNGQPYGSLSAQNPAENMMPTDQPKTTFWRQNSSSNSAPPSFVASGADTLETPYPRVHLDRILTSPTEIMTTPFCRPHEYLLLNDAQFSYCKPWFDSSTRLYRFLEFVQAGDIRVLNDTRTNTLDAVGAEGGRVSGKINLNTVTLEGFYALCDAQPGNRFTDSQILSLYNRIVSMRPFWGNGVGQSAGGDAVNSGNARTRNQTIFANHPAGAPSDTGDLVNLAFDPLHSEYNGGPFVGSNNLGLAVNGMTRGQELHPSVRTELLNKIYGRTTSRSNCFAVWLTVGFFEVVSESGRSDAFAPQVILGKELQPVQRRKFFSLVDRTQLECWRVSPDTSIATRPESAGNVVSPPPGGEAVVPLSQFVTLSGGFVAPLLPPTGITNPKTGKSYLINFKTVLTFDPDSPYGNEETVAVENIDSTGMAPTMGVRLKKSHGIYSNITVVNRGNPGPVKDYKVEEDTLVVPYFAVLE